MYPPELKTKRLTIKAYNIADESRFIEMTLDEISVRYMGGASGDEAEERALFKKIFDLYKRTDERWFWIWAVYKDNVLCGHLELKQTEHTNEDELELVYIIHPDERRKGIMTEIFSLLKEEQKNWQKKTIATVNPDNSPSIALLQKWGIDKKEILTDRETGKEYFKLILSN